MSAQRDLDDRITAAKDLIAQREEIDRQLAELFGGAVPAKVTRACSKCGKQGHSARTCSTEQPAEPPKMI
jgi:hypothetical protein